MGDAGVWDSFILNLRGGAMANYDVKIQLMATKTDGTKETSTFTLEYPNVGYPTLLAMEKGVAEMLFKMGDTKAASPTG